MQFIVFCLLNDGRPPETMEEFMACSPFVEMLGAEPLFKRTKRTGGIKTHLQCHRLRPWQYPEAKYIYVTRNPYDCCVSFFHHTRGFPSYRFEDGSFEEFFEMFMNGHVDFGEYFDHQIPWFQRRNDRNVLYLTYESLKKDTASGIFKVADFLEPQIGIKLRENPEALQEIVQATSIESMRMFNREFVKWLPTMLQLTASRAADTINEEEKEWRVDMEKLMVGQFVRKGAVGDWRYHFTPELIRRMKKKIALRTAGTGFMDLWKDTELP
ncbi:hypothetical protein V5799_007764 [Amblyomma americanum]|uniref:Sulfotransferase domain-containing protein n=1 Tax=Amblyomma americanum TaxID=6943 RepID=A0AAQ4FGV4_AMBAM